MKCLAEKSIDGSSCGIGVNVEPYCQRSGKTSGGAHAESAGAGPNGVDRVFGASLIVDAGSSCWDSGRTSLQRCRKSDGTDERHWKGRRSREAWPRIESGGAKENDGGGWQLFFRSLEKLGEKLSCPSCRVRAARAAFLSHPGATMPCGAPRGSIEAVSVELWRRFQRRWCCSSSV